MNISGTLQGRSCQNPWAHSSLSTWEEEFGNSSTCESGARREDRSGLEQLCTNKHGLSFFHLLALSRSISLSLSVSNGNSFLAPSKKNRMQLWLFLNCERKPQIWHFSSQLLHGWDFQMNRCWAIAIATFLHNCQIISDKCDFMSHKSNYFSQLWLFIS